MSSVVRPAFDNTFLAAGGRDLANSLVEKERLELAREILAQAEASSTEVLLPEDVIVTDDLGKPKLILSVPLGEDPENPDSVLSLTAVGARSLDGYSWGRAGVTPDEEVSLRWEEFSADNDPQLDAAIEAAEALVTS